MTRSCIIIDDEKLAREKIALYLGQVEGLNLKGAYATGTDFLQNWKLPKNLLIFLDINLPDLNGLELAQIVNPGNQIIFTTAYSEFAFQGFELDAVDYLLKPFTIERFFRAIAKAQNSYPHDQCLYIKEGKKTHRLTYADIYYIEGLKEYVIWHTLRGKIVAYNSLKKLKEQLSSKGFFQIHKSYIVNFSKIDYFEANAIHIQGVDLPIGRTFKEVFADYIV